MPAMMRAKGKASKIAYDIKGSPFGEKTQVSKKSKKKKPKAKVLLEENRVV